jgi:hypothetical protein
VEDGLTLARSLLEKGLEMQAYKEKTEGETFDLQEQVGVGGVYLCVFNPISLWTRVFNPSSLYYCVFNPLYVFKPS